MLRYYSLLKGVLGYTKRILKLAAHHTPFTKLPGKQNYPPNTKATEIKCFLTDVSTALGLGSKWKASD